MADVFVKLDESGLRQILQGNDGPVFQELQRRVLKVHAAAVQNCPVDTGRLRSSIRWSMGTDSQGLVGLVGSDVEYAGYINDGTWKMSARPFLTNALLEAAGD